MKDNMANITKEIAEIKEAYNSSPRRENITAIVYGGIGAGKTSLLGTARKPVLIDSFDPGGTKPLESKIKAGEILVDPSFEHDDPMAPKAWALWARKFKQRFHSGLFNHVGTYAIDSLTTWSQACLADILAKANRAGGVPQQNDWYPQMVAMENAVRNFLQLPCSVILIAHEDTDKDEISGRIVRNLMITGKAKVRIPGLMDELWYAHTTRTGKGVEYKLRTQKNSSEHARSRLSREGLLDEVEPADIKHILAKAGYPTDDLPLNITESLTKE